MTVSCFLSSFFNEYNDLNDLPNNGGSVTFYLTGTTTLAEVWTEHTGSIANTNPVIFDSQGYPIEPIWLPVAENYDAIVKDALDNTVFQLNYIGLPPVAPAQGFTDINVWVDTLLIPTILTTKSFTLVGVWDDEFIPNRRVKIDAIQGGSAVSYFGSVASAAYSGGSGLTTVVLVMDGTSTIDVSASIQHCSYSAINSIDVPSPYIGYSAQNVGSADAIVANYNPSVYALEDGTRLTVVLSAPNATTTPTFSPNGLTAKVITRGDGTALAASDLLGTADIVYNASADKWLLLNQSFSSNDSKWDLLPLGYAQPFIPQIMGTTLALWLTAHPKWAKLTNTQVPLIEGRAMAVSSATALGNTQAGSAISGTGLHTHTATTPAHAHAGSTVGAHTHPVVDSGHTHTISGGQAFGIDGGGAGIFSIINPNLASATDSAVTGITIGSDGGTLSIASQTQVITVANAGSAIAETNIPPTQYFDWIYKHTL